jgi:beta-N-acetylhexosaminidase
VAVCGCGGGGRGGDADRRGGGPALTIAGDTGASGPGSRPAALTLRQAIGQRFVFPYAGLEPPPQLVRRIARGEAAGVILFGRNVRSTARLRQTLDRLQRVRRPEGALGAPLLVLADHEGGPVRRLPGPPEAAAADTRTAAAAEANGRAAGHLLRAGGVNVDLAPVVDVARAGSALETERRLYGRDPATVARLGRAFAAGLRATGVAPVLKHFPGFGAATVNTDDGAARVDLPLSTLRRVDAAPFAAVDAPAVMLSTAIYPRVDPRPAAFSRRWVTDELRGRLGFKGVTITDDLQTPAVARFGSPAQLAFFAVRAGVDLPLFAQSYAAADAAARGLERAVRSGALPRSQLAAGAARVLAWRAAIGDAG